MELIPGHVLSPDGKILACGGSSIALQLRKIGDDKDPCDVPCDKTVVEKIVFSPDGKKLAWNGSTVWVYDLETKQREKPVKFRAGAVQALAYTPKNKLLVAVIPLQRGPCAIAIWDGDSGEKTATCEGHTDVIGSCVFDWDCKTLASASLDRTVRLWDVATGKNLTTFKEMSYAGGLAFSPDGKLLAMGYRLRLEDNRGGGLRVYEIVSGRMLAELAGETMTAPVFSLDGKLLASGSGNKIKLWTIPAAWTAEK